MRHVDFSPLYRSTVGFDRLFTMLDSLGQPEQAQSYPPYNIERTGENPTGSPWPWPASTKASFRSKHQRMC